MRPVLPLVLVGFLAPGAASPQSLAEAAAKEKERRQQQEKKSKAGETQSFTDEDLPSKGKKASPSPATTAGRPPAKSKQEAPDDDSRGDEKTWRSRAHAARQAVASAQGRIDGLNAKAQQLLWQKMQSTDTNEILRLGTEQTKVQNDLQQAKEQLTNAQKALVDFEEEARRSSVPPGWLDETRP